MLKNEILKGLIYIFVLLIVCTPSKGFASEQSNTAAENDKNTHVHSIKEVKGTPATCTASGNNAYWTCTECGKVFSDENGTKEENIDNFVIPALGHDFGEWTELNSWQHQRVCSNDIFHVEKQNHTWDEGKITKAATDNDYGIKTYTCTVCKATKIEYFLKPRQIWYRLYGKGRFDTMQAIVDKGFPHNGGTVVIATGFGFKDALAASGLAGIYNAPVVLTDGKNLSPQAKSVLAKLKPKWIYIAGGPSAVSENVSNQLKKATGLSPWRVAGKNSAETSAKLALEGKGHWKDGTAIIATNKSFKDALSVAPIAYAKKYPILLADNGKSLSKEVLDALSSIGTKQVIIVGGTGAVTKNVENQLNKKGISVKIRLGGNNGVETSYKIASWGLANGMTANNMGVATSQNYPDALAGAAFCGLYNSVLVLADDKATYNTKFPKPYKDKMYYGYVFGGESAVGKKTWDLLEESTR